ncbi:EAL domain-containing protein [Kineococcus rubinsiae]|uniref:EAL domain-containing protein n=1 Tax=Kineococcus rubinsiae TaxID=2609562 RepID=UPI0014318A7B|nr:EAL domain-containing protein [Kineococcus rubinsiae]
MSERHDRVRWHRRLDSLADDPTALRLVLHPVVDVVAGRVAGYEALSRFDSRLPTEAWFDAARALGRSPEVDRLVLSRALPLQATLPHGTFLTVNASPTSLREPEVLDTLLAHDLSSVIVEVTEHADCAPYDLLEPLRRLRARGAKIALDDVGTGHSGLLRMAVLRPEMVKVDLQLVRGVAGDLVKRSLVQFLGQCAARLDAWIVAEGVETTEELDVLTSMGVPLVQGFLLAHPDAAFQQLSPAAASLLAAAAPARRPDQGRRLASELTRRTKTVRTAVEASEIAAADCAPVVVVDHQDVPQLLVLPAPRPGDSPRVTRIDVTLAPETAVADVAERAVARHPATRFDPVVCTDATGRYVGVVGVEDVLLDLARHPGGPGEVDLRATATVPATRSVR